MYCFATYTKSIYWSDICDISNSYVIPYGSMHPWLYWIYWINPLAYSFKAMISNEMMGQIYSCEGPGNAVPYGPGYDDWNYKVCTMKGGQPGQNFVLGDDYLRAQYSYYTSQLWAPNFIVVNPNGCILPIMIT